MTSFTIFMLATIIVSSSDTELYQPPVLSELAAEQLHNIDIPWFIRCGQGVPNEAISWEVKSEDATAAAELVRSFNLAQLDSAAAKKTSLPQIQAKDILIDGVSDISRIRDEMQKSPLQAVVLRQSFSIPEELSFEWAMNNSGSFTLNNGYYGSSDVNGESERNVAKSCGVESPAPFRNKATKCNDVTLKEYFSTDIHATDYHMFYATRSEIDEPSCNDPDHKTFPSDTVMHTLAEAFLGDAARNVSLGLNLRKALRNGHRPMATSMRAATTIRFHSHSATWFALTHGRKAWWMGPAKLASVLKQVGNDNNAASPCQYLNNPPHPDLTLFIQEPGDVILFGEQVPHATCALEPSFGIGNQMGFYKDAYVDLSTDPKCVGSFGAAKCKQTESARAGVSNLFLTRHRHVASEDDAQNTQKDAENSHSPAVVNKKTFLSSRKVSFLQVPTRSYAQSAAPWTTEAHSLSDDVCAA